MLQEHSDPTPPRQTTPSNTDRTAHQWAVLRGVNKGHAVGDSEEEFRPRTDAIWVRPGCKRVRPDLNGAKLWDALAWMPARKGEPMSQRDRETLEELRVRAWVWDDISRRRGWYEPAWLDGLVPGRRAGGYRKFLQILLSCYRSGAVGVFLGYHECRAYCDVHSDSTWRRWTAEMERLGLIRIQQTWIEDTGPTARERKYGKLLYCLGPAFHAAIGVGLLEGLDLPERTKGQPTGGWARREAKRARHITRAERDTRRRAIWEERNSRTGSSFNSSSILAEHNPSLRSGSEACPIPGKRNSKDGASRVATLASPARLNKTPTADVVATKRDVARGAKRIGRADSASSNEGGLTPEMSSMANDLISRLRRQLRSVAHALLFFVSFTLYGCRETPHIEFGDPLESTESSTDSTPDELPASTEGSATWATTWATTGPATSSTTWVGESSSGGESSSESTTGDGWGDALDDACVRECWSLEYAKLNLWCEALTSPGTEDLSTCRLVVKDAALFRCAGDCEWSCHE